MDRQKHITDGKNVVESNTGNPYSIDYVGDHKDEILRHTFILMGGGRKLVRGGIMGAGLMRMRGGEIIANWLLGQNNEDWRGFVREIGAHYKPLL